MATDRSNKTKALADKSKNLVMLAHKYSEKKHVLEPTNKRQVSIKDWMVFDKIDGIRAIFTDQGLVSRYGNKFSVPDEFMQALYDAFKSINLIGMDGELVSIKGFQHTTSVVRDQTNKVSMDYWKDIRYKIFDHQKVYKSFEERLDVLNTKHIKNEYISILNPITTVKNNNTLLDEMSKVAADNKEGLIIRNPYGEYKFGRSWDLLKVKIFDDCEAEVINYYKGEGKYSSLIGGLVCKLPSGVEFECGTGLTDNDRANPPGIGKKVTIKFMGLTELGKPRHPVYICTRDYED